MTTPQASVSLSGTATIAESQNPNLGDTVPANGGCTCAESLAGLMSSVHDDNIPSRDAVSPGQNCTRCRHCKNVSRHAPLNQHALDTNNIQGEPYMTYLREYVRCRGSYMYLDGNFGLSRVRFTPSGDDIPADEPSSIPLPSFDVAYLWNPSYNYRVE
ncbi:hypothetical protein BDZ89DRAFT_1140447 [Hymenopellis radicata]|nr:hypothetical protein BDZ89DRAFT_1140447 [Hymenopellis radicata]